MQSHDSICITNDNNIDKTDNHIVHVLSTSIYVYIKSLHSNIHVHVSVFDTPTSPTDMSGDIVCRTGESC